ncbi:family 16 glycoside hydrolase [Maioricimonas rarisocia]|uniref:family 16 glycoside hydrolase n=1 Tax=Maioricimonas rarisocia TaxID=2528026 RepID=UPI0011A7AAD3|nr:family 16 glycoside hydrolase [Maioricimonas rarisocia]
MNRLVVVAAAALLLTGCPSEPANESTARSAPAAAEPQAELPPLPPPQFEAGTCRIESEPAGLRVFVDGRPVFDAEGKPVVTPCRVTAEAGPHTVTLAGEQSLDFSRQVRFDSEDEFLLTASVQEGTSEALQQPLLQMPAGQPLPLASLNSAGNEFDPFVAADGRSIWFAGDRAEGRGIYVATRSGPYAMFGEPQLVRLTRGTDQPASPSVTADGLSIVYTLRSKARIWGLTRENPLQPFSERVPLHFSSDTGETWPTCQSTGDGERIYYQQEQDAETDTRVVLRSGPTKAFSKVLIVDMPGGVPCLSSDGLRQYVYDGQQLLRARRATVREPFRDGVPILELALPNFVAAPGYRQYFVTDDEQWMFYADDPAASGDLYVVRLSDQPGWGLPLLGEAVQPDEAGPKSESADSPQMAMRDEPDAKQLRDEPVEADDRLPYTRFREDFRSLVGQKKYQEASALIERAAKNPELTAAREMLAWDRDDLEAMSAFQDDVARVIESLEPGDEIRLGSYRFELIQASPESLTLKGKTREIVRPVADMDPPDIAGIVDATIAEDDSPVRLRLAVFAMYMPGFPQRTRQRYAEKAGTDGEQLREEHARRLLQQAEWELDRQRTTTAKELLARIEEAFPESESAQRASDIRDSLYTRIQWTRRGRRQWQTGPLGEFTASDERADGSLLVSPQRYDHFELTMEYRTNSPTGQGGVFFRYPGSGRPYDSAFKIQLSNDRGVAADAYSTGALFSFDAPSKNAAGPQGEWNEFRMLVEGTRVAVEINGEQVLRTTASDPEIPKSGFVALDGITGGISYRKILITDLSGSGD